MGSPAGPRRRYPDDRTIAAPPGLCPLTVAAIFHEHLLEHLPLDAAVGLLYDSYRVLVLDGVLRIGVPDAGAYLHSYANPEDGFIEQVRPDRPTRLLAVQEVFQHHGHRSAYDFETLRYLLEAVGFRGVERRPSGDSRLTTCPAADDRRAETLYVEGVR